MRICLACQQPIPTIEHLRRERRWHWITVGTMLLMVGVITGSLGYLVRDAVFVKRENAALSRLLDAYVKRVETDKVVDHNKGLQGQLRAKGREGKEQTRRE